MEFVGLGKTGEKLPVLGMGTWKLGSERQSGIDALRKGMELGTNFIDTAEMYGTEDMVGEAMKDQEVFLATKVSPSHFHYDDVIKACDNSLKRLGINRIDLYQLHWPNPSIQISETMRAMEKLVEDDKIRYIGVSNFSVEQVEEAQGALKSNEIVSNQVEYSVIEKEPERGLSDFCKREKITIIAYSPLGQGALYSGRYKTVMDGLGRLGSKYNKTPSQIALNWLVSKGNISAIPKAGRSEHMKENLGAVGWKISSEDLKTIDSLA